MRLPQPAREFRRSPAALTCPPTQRHRGAAARSAGADERRPVPYGGLSIHEVLRLQRSAGNRATVQLLTQGTPKVQRAVSHSASWPAVGASPEEVLIQQLDPLVTTAENAAVVAVANNLGIKTPRQATYLQQPSPRTWGYVVEEQLDPLATGAGWSTQHRLSGARPDYHRVSNAIEVYVDLTSVGQAGIGGNHITDKLDNAGFTTPDTTVAAADVTHRSLDPQGKAAAVVVLGNATMQQVRALQQYRRLTKSYVLKETDVDFSSGIAKLFNKYGDIKHSAFTTSWTNKKRQTFTDRVLKALGKSTSVAPKKHNTRLHAKFK